MKHIIVRTSLKSRLSLLMVASVLILSACSGQEPAEQPHQQTSGTPVKVARVLEQRITEWDQFTGRVEAPQTVSLRPRVSGYIDYIAFEEGSLVKQGQPLFFIDNRPFKAEVKRLRAALKTAKSQYELASKELDRATSLREQNAISQEVLDSRMAAVQQTEANVTSTQAQLDLAKLNLSFTRVEAPIAGRISQAMITRGNYVNAGQSVLTTIVSTDQVYVYFDADEQTYLKYNQLALQGKRASSRDTAHPVFMGLASDKAYPYSGVIDFLDNQINQATGTIRGRAVFSNTDSSLIPGLFARIKLAGSATYNGILVADKAISTDLSNRYVLVVDEKNNLHYRKVTLGEKLNGLRIIKQGLSANETIVVGGLQRVRPGATVMPELVPMADDSTLQAIRIEQQRIDQVNSLTELADNEADTGSQDTAAPVGV